ncbi:hypothetical protein FACS1894137_16860 [Spirochaetia bacterium]|nr:hypothetical protein FACS1894137_16860 [Spirochaetia bacterium]
MADRQDIIASIRLGLDQLDKDIHSAEGKVEKMAGDLSKKSKIQLRIDLDELNKNVKEGEAKLKS